MVTCKTLYLQQYYHSQWFWLSPKLRASHCFTDKITVSEQSANLPISHRQETEELGLESAEPGPGSHMLSMPFTLGPRDALHKDGVSFHKVDFIQRFG